MIYLRTIIFYALAAASLLPFTGSAAALGMGLAYALIFGDQIGKRHAHASKIGLGIVIAMLGAGVNIIDTLKLGGASAPLTFVTITVTLIAAWGIGKLFKLDHILTALIGFGTAICGGSAIAALSPAIKANSTQISIALACVFALNALALIAFPAIGTQLDLSQQQFGTWAALAIHDTSSVVGASQAYGPQALETATIMKLVRALWITPFVIAIAWLLHARDHSAQHTPPLSRIIPWFIPAFLIMSAAFTWGQDLHPAIPQLSEHIIWTAKRLMEGILFLIGANLSRSALAHAGWRAFAMATSLWLLVSTASLLLILHMP